VDDGDQSPSITVHGVALRPSGSSGFYGQVLGFEVWLEHLGEGWAVHVHGWGNRDANWRVATLEDATSRAEVLICARAEQLAALVDLVRNRGGGATT
jgi:hypothetical protein